MHTMLTLATCCIVLMLSSCQTVQMQLEKPFAPATRKEKFRSTPSVFHTGSLAYKDWAAEDLSFGWSGRVSHQEKVNFSFMKVAASGKLTNQKFSYVFRDGKKKSPVLCRLWFSTVQMDSGLISGGEQRYFLGCKLLDKQAPATMEIAGNAVERQGWVASAAGRLTIKSTRQAEHTSIPTAGITGYHFYRGTKPDSAVDVMHEGFTYQPARPSFEKKDDKPGRQQAAPRVMAQFSLWLASHFAADFSDHARADEGT